MTRSFLAFMTLSFLFSIIKSFSMIMPTLALYYLLMKRVRLYCKVTKELKKAPQKWDIIRESERE